MCWNLGLEAGFGSFLIGTFFNAVGYLVLILCQAEMTSALPFAGKKACNLTVRQLQMDGRK